MGRLTQKLDANPGVQVYLVFFLYVYFLVAYVSYITYEQSTGTADSNYSIIVEFSVVALAFVYTLLIAKEGYGPLDRVLIQLAHGFALLGDLFLVLLGWFHGGGWMIPGMCAFLCSQIALIIRHSRNLHATWYEALAALTCYAIAGCLFAYYVLPGLPPELLLPVGVYALVLTTGLWMGVGTLWRNFYPKSIAAFIALGVICFFMTDLYVILNYKASSSTQHSVPIEFRGTFFGFLIWMFYIPTQVLLASSGYRLRFLRSVFPVIPRMQKDAGERFHSRFTR